MSNPLDNNPFATPDPGQVERNEALREQQEQERSAAQQQQWAQRQQWAQHQQQQWAHQQAAQQGGPPPPYQAGPTPLPYHQGAGQPPSPQSGPPAPYPPGPYPPPYAPQYLPPTMPGSARTSGVAIAALVVGILSVFMIPLGIVALILGIIALRGIKRTHMAGRGMAITGVIIGSITTAIVVAMITLAVILIPQAGVSANVTKPQVISSHQATSGHCLDEMPQTTTEELKYSLVPCDQPHVAEILSRKSVDRMGEFPTNDLEIESAIIDCLHNSGSTWGLEQAGLENFEIFLVYPPEDVWDDEGAIVDVHCMVRPVSGQMTGRAGHSNLELVP